MIEIIQEGGMVETPAIELCFWYVGHRGNWGFCFPCNDKGKVNVGSLNPTARDRYEKCAAGTMQPEIERPVILHHTANQPGTTDRALPLWRQSPSGPLHQHLPKMRAGLQLLWNRAWPARILG
jgi:hypothetical protein